MSNGSGGQFISQSRKMAVCLGYLFLTKVHQELSESFLFFVFWEFDVGYMLFYIYPKGLVAYTEVSNREPFFT